MKLTKTQKNIFREIFTQPFTEDRSGNVEYGRSLIDKFESQYKGIDVASVAIEAFNKAATKEQATEGLEYTIGFYVSVIKSRIFDAIRAEKRKNEKLKKGVVVGDLKDIVFYSEDGEELSSAYIPDDNSKVVIKGWDKLTEEERAYAILLETGNSRRQILEDHGIHPNKQRDLRYILSKKLEVSYE